MDNLSKVIFTCLAICITLLVYQNTQLNDDVDILKNRIEILENPYEDGINVDVYEKCLVNFRDFLFNMVGIKDHEIVEEFCENLATE